MSTGRVQKFLRDGSGSMTVEFVVLTPLLLSALVFSFEFGKGLWAYDVITRDVRAGVRYISRDSTVPTPPPAGCPTSAQNIAQTGSPTDATDANKHFPWKGVTSTFTCTATNFTTADYNTNGQVVTMTASVPVTLTFLGFLNSVLSLTGGSVIPTTYPLSVSYQARLIGN
jgi:Flp pilus assembly protein TadG